MKLPTGIRQRGNSLIVDVTVNGVRRTGTVAGLDVVKAVALQAELKSGMLKSIVGEQQARNVWTLKQAYEKTCELHWNERESKSWEQLRANGEQALAYFGEAATVDSITSERLDAYAKSLEDAGLVGGTVNRKMSAISKLLTVAIQKGKLTARPHVERKREFAGRLRWLSDDEEKVILSVFDQWGMDEVSEAICVLVDTGLRPSELWVLERRDIDFATNFIHVWDSKNDDARSVPMMERTRDILKRRCEITKKGPLFPYDNFWMHRAWSRMRTHLSMDHDKEFIPYVLRHTCASRLVQNGVPLEHIRIWLGHKSIITTQRYAKTCPQNLVDAVKILEQKKRSGTA
jgi:site-specific recombinase XerD